ncbi:hypothetical protein Pmani_038903 [Petrolisthes manimaculis]|uniref:Uncharacterized protein n=1 Tax=Petrolisthes manimaculis TaxID=1843537 RepID=A0AAE1TJZ3_9EUCA|nr:hypothetical protein Pmani_038903 [Petrolisthes manimaculis]
MMEVEEDLMERKMMKKDVTMRKEMKEKMNKRKVVGDLRKNKMFVKMMGIKTEKENDNKKKRYKMKEGGEGE